MKLRPRDKTDRSPSVRGKEGGMQTTWFPALDGGDGGSVLIGGVEEGGLGTTWPSVKAMELEGGMWTTCLTAVMESEREGDAGGV